MSRPRYAVEQPPEGERRALLKRVENGAFVLDVGCWAGWAGSFLIDERGATVDGVEPDFEMAAIAERCYRRVMATSIEAALDTLLAEQSGSYDTLLFFDVLEHLLDPGAVLAESRSLLKPGGSALVSLPNVAHWSLRKHLLVGRWDYQDSGLLDRTHLRFFTRSTAEELLSSAGWTITAVSFSLAPPPLVRLPDRHLGILRLWPAMFAVQNLFVVRPR